MKSLTSLVRHILDDVQYGCGTSTTRDFLTITRRVEHEGLSFLTITLPTFARSFERALERGSVDSTDFTGFSRVKSGAIPKFLQGLLSLVFDAKTGTILNDPSIVAISDIRQVCLMFKKVKLECTQERIQAAFDRYVEADSELSCLWEKVDDSLKREFSQLSRVLWSDSSISNPLFGDLNGKIRTHSLMPKHGPGATAERISGNRKFALRSWHQRLESHFPLDFYGLSRPDLALQVGDSIEFSDPGSELPVRVISVPKTLKTPRIIAIEPVCMQYLQQAVLGELVPLIQSHPLSSGHVNFTSQTVNQREALDSSKTKRLATLDLSEASDRVALPLVELMLSHHPDLLDAVLAVRSLRADVPGKGVITLFKYASMGSALCFPIEAMVFYTLVLLGIHKSHGTRPSFASIRKYKKGVRVYGDDIIVPVEYVLPVMQTLEAFGLKVNAAKSFWKGNFRESCGVDAYNGYEVSPTYVGHLPPTDRQCTQEIQSWASLCNHLWKRGYWRASEYCRKVVESALKQKLPLTSSTSPGLGLHSFIERATVSGWNKHLHEFTTRAPVVRQTPRPSTIDGYGALMKFFLKRSDEPIFSAKHLMYAGRPISARIKNGKVPSLSLTW